MLTDNTHPQHQRIVEHLLKEGMNLLTDSEMKMFKQELVSLSLDELVDSFLPQWYDDLWIRKPVPVKEWLFSEEHMNMKGSLFPRLADDLEEMFEGDYEEAVIEGAIGWGKSYFTSISLTRMIYEVSCFKNPQIAYGIANGTPIRFANVAVNAKTAKEIVFDYVKKFVNGSEYFQKHFKLNKDLEKELNFPNNVSLFPATSSQTGAIGQNLFGAVLDEANFFHKVENSAYAVNTEEIYDPAKVLWNTMSRRIRSRFARQGSTPGILLTASSSMYPDDFTSWRWKTAQENGETSKVFYRRYAQWETKPESFYSDRKFLISIGNNNKRPRIIQSPESPKYDSELDDIEKLKAEEIEIMEVPEDFRASFERDIDMAVRDEAGRATQATHPFFRDLSPFDRSIQRGLEKNLRHPYTQESTTLQDGAGWVKHNLDYSKRFNPHFASIDLSLSGDSAGITILRLDGAQQRETKTYKDDGFSTEYIPTQSYEWLPQATQVMTLRINPPTEGEIQIDAVRGIIVDLINWGFVFKGITLDRFQSVSTVQFFKNMGLNAYEQSVDRTMAPYLTLREYLTSDRLDMYHYSPIRQEAAFVEINTVKGKIDHPPQKTKDVLDSLAAAIASLDKFSKENPGFITQGESAMDTSAAFSVGYDDLDDFRDLEDWTVS